jgi:hypothetical protein
MTWKSLPDAKRIYFRDDVEVVPTERNWSGYEFLQSSLPGRSGVFCKEIGAAC